jgi:hypothetical protein
LETEKCPVCGTSVKKENLKGHLERVHAKRTGSIGERQVVEKTVPVFRSHRRRNVLILALVALAVIGVSVAAAQFSASQTLRLHWHPVLTITGSTATVPAQIGIDQSLWKDHSLDQYGVGGLAPLHTHDTSGTIHVESNTVRDFTLHEFLAIWGQPSDGSAIDGHPVTSLTVDGVQQASPTGDVILKDGQKIVMTLSP